MNKQLLIGIIVVILAAGGFFLYNAQGKNANPSQSSPSAKNTQTISGVNFENPKKSAHYESNSPAHGAVLGAQPLNVVIDFNFDLAKPSSISITKDDKEYGTGDTVIDTNKLAMRRNFDPKVPDGTYTVTYKACWPDSSCHDGNFQFAIQRSKASVAVDMTNKETVTVDLADSTFAPKDIRISKGTTVVWTNSDDVAHFVNTDSHPAHTYYKEQNSKEMQKGDTFSLAFNTPGAYPYHCSAHADSMSGNLIVE